MKHESLVPIVDLGKSQGGSPVLYIGKTCTMLCSSNDSKDARCLVFRKAPTANYILH